MLMRLIAVGIDGVEVNHPSNSETVRLDLRGIATATSLIMTGGSDFHGANKPRIELGRGFEGNLNVPRSVLNRLRAM